MISLGLLAVWQIPLLFGSISTLDQQNQARSGQLNQRLSQGERPSARHQRPPSNATGSGCVPPVPQRSWMALISAEPLQHGGSTRT